MAMIPLILANSCATVAADSKVWNAAKMRWSSRQNSPTSTHACASSSMPRTPMRSAEATPFAANSRCVANAVCRHVEWRGSHRLARQTALATCHVSTPVAASSTGRRG